MEVEHPVPSAPRSELPEVEEAGVAGGHCAEEASTAIVAGDASLVPDQTAPVAVTPIAIPLVGTCAVKRAIPPSLRRSGRYVIPLFRTAVIVDVVWLFTLAAFRSMEPLLGFAILGRSMGFVHLPMRLEQPSGDKTAVLTVAQVLPLATLHSPFAENSAVAKDRSRCLV